MNTVRMLLGASVLCFVEIANGTIASSEWSVKPSRILHTSNVPLTVTRFSRPAENRKFKFHKFKKLLKYAKHQKFKKPNFYSLPQFGSPQFSGYPFTFQLVPHQNQQCGWHQNSGSFFDHLFLRRNGLVLVHPNGSLVAKENYNKENGGKYVILYPESLLTFLQQSSKKEYAGRKKKRFRYRSKRPWRPSSWRKAPPYKTPPEFPLKEPIPGDIGGTPPHSTLVGSYLDNRIPVTEFVTEKTITTTDIVYITYSPNTNYDNFSQNLYENMQTNHFDDSPYKTIIDPNVSTVPSHIPDNKTAGMVSSSVYNPYTDQQASASYINQNFVASRVFPQKQNISIPQISNLGKKRYYINTVDGAVSTESDWNGLINNQSPNVSNPLGVNFKDSKPNRTAHQHHEFKSNSV